MHLLVTLQCALAFAGVTSQPSLSSKRVSWSHGQCSACRAPHAAHARCG